MSKCTNVTWSGRPCHAANAGGERRGFSPYTPVYRRLRRSERVSSMDDFALLTTREAVTHSDTSSDPQLEEQVSSQAR